MNLLDLSMETYVGQQNNNLFCQRIEKKWQFCSIQGFFTELTQLFIKGLKKRKQESTFLTFFFFFFSCSALYQWNIWNSRATSYGKTLESNMTETWKGLRTVRNDYVEQNGSLPLLLLKFQNSLQPIWKLLSLSKCLLGETRVNREPHMVLWLNGLVFKKHFKLFYSTSRSVMSAT